MSHVQELVAICILFPSHLYCKYPIIIEQIEKTGDKEKIISEMRIPLENAPEEIREVIDNMMME